METGNRKPKDAKEQEMKDEEGNEGENGEVRRRRRADAQVVPSTKLSATVKMPRSTKFVGNVRLADSQHASITITTIPTSLTVFNIHYSCWLRFTIQLFLSHILLMVI